jgi:hypothetical protein
VPWGFRTLSWKKERKASTYLSQFFRTHGTSPGLLMWTRSRFHAHSFCEMWQFWTQCLCSAVQIIFGWNKKQENSIAVVKYDLQNFRSPPMWEIVIRKKLNKPLQVGFWNWHSNSNCSFKVLSWTRRVYKL